MNWQEKYKLCENAYNSNGGFEDGEYLYKLSKEEDDKYVKRLTQSPFKNYLKDVVSSFTSHIFKRDVYRIYSKQKDVIQKLIDDIDLQGNNINIFMQDLAKETKAFGVMFVLVDMPKIERANFKNQIDNRELPYLVKYSPNQLYDYALDRFGKLEWVVFKESYDEKKPFTNEINRKIKYRYFDKERWEVREGSEIIESGEHNLNVNPVLILSENNRFPNTSDFYEVALLSKAIYNLNSLGDQQLRDQFLNLFVFQITEEIMRSLNTKEEAPPIKFSTDNTLAYLGNQKPEFISPDASTVEIIENKISNYEKRIDRVANYIQSGFSAESGVALENKFEGLNAKLNDFSNRLKDFELRVWDIIGKWLNINFEIEVIYPATFQIQDTKELIDNYLTIKDDINSKIFKKEVKKKIASQILQNTNQETKDEIFKEIEEELLSETQT